MAGLVCRTHRPWQTSRRSRRIRGHSLCLGLVLVLALYPEPVSVSDLYPCPELAWPQAGSTEETPQESPIYTNSSSRFLLPIARTPSPTGSSIHVWRNDSSCSLC